MLKKLLIAAALAAGLPLAIVALYLAWMTATDFRPKPALNLEIRNNARVNLKKGVPFSVLTFNIGYCGMDAGADFFMDGGKGSRGRSLEATQAILRRIAAFLAGEKSDLVLLQEVDRRATRSYRVDQVEELERSLAGLGSVFAVNYKVPWVPVPLTRPMGAVHSGLLTLSRYHLLAAIRRQLPGNEAWPRQLAELDRCLSECRLSLEGGGELVLYNLHLSVFDKGGGIRRQQLADLRGRLLAERQKGNYVIAGGDWNHGLRGCARPLAGPAGAPGRLAATMAPSSWYRELPADFTPPGFSWALDPTTPTVRSSAVAYKPGVNFVAVIDGFLVSDNIEVQQVAVRDLAFQNSDHNPVTAVLVLR